MQYNRHAFSGSLRSWCNIGGFNIGSVTRNPPIHQIQFPANISGYTVVNILPFDPYQAYIEDTLHHVPDVPQAAQLYSSACISLYVRVYRFITISSSEENTRTLGYHDG